MIYTWAPARSSNDSKWLGKQSIVWKNKFKESLSKEWSGFKNEFKIFYL